MDVHSFPHRDQEPASLALLDVATSTGTSAVCHCYSVQEMEDGRSEMAGWSEGKALTAPSNSAHCVLGSHIPSSSAIYSASDTALHRRTSVAGQHKTHYVHGRSSSGLVGRSDSRTSLKSYMYNAFDRPPIHYVFRHYGNGGQQEEDIEEFKDMASFYAEFYRRQHTYPTLQQRVVSGRADGSAHHSLYCNCTSSGMGTSHHVSPVLKPKLVVLGQGKLASVCMKPDRKKPQVSYYSLSADLEMCRSRLDLAYRYFHSLNGVAIGPAVLLRLTVG